MTSPISSTPATATFNAEPTMSNLAVGKQVLTMEAQAILDLADRLSPAFEQSVELILNCTGKVVVAGIGKSGHIGNKIAATFASTGTPAFFVHPAELRHGDFGMLDERDLLIALSGSGETQEIKLILEPIKRRGLKIIAFTGGLKSTLANFSDIVIDVKVPREACPLNLAPTSSTTATLAMGDALAMAVMTRKGFGIDDFARSHPGGALGQQLLQIKDIMHTSREIPTVNAETKYADILKEMNEKNYDFAVVVDGHNKLTGVITHGDMRRAQVKFGNDIFDKSAKDVMFANPKTISANSLAVEALKMMDKHHISDLPIVDENGCPSGFINLKDLVHSGII